MALRDELEHSGEWLFRHRSYLPLLLLAVAVGSMAGHPHPASHAPGDVAWELLCVAVSLLGLAVRVVTVGHAPDGTSGRNTHGQVADALNTTGAYSLVRHPLYVGNYLMWLGVTLFPRVAWLPVFVTLVFWLYYERIMLAEEAFLRARYGDAFEQWAALTPTFVPRPHRWPRDWRPPALPFSARTVLRREYTGVFALVATFTLLELVGDSLTAGRPALALAWMDAFVATAIAYVLLRLLKRRTRLLHVAGR